MDCMDCTWMLLQSCSWYAQAEYTSIHSGLSFPAHTCGITRGDFCCPNCPNLWCYRAAYGSGDCGSCQSALEQDTEPQIAHSRQPNMTALPQPVCEFECVWMGQALFLCAVHLPFLADRVWYFQKAVLGFCIWKQPKWVPLYQQVSAVT